VTPPLILVSNDDGIHAAGIHALRQALEPLGEVWVVAPELEQSAVSHGMTLTRPVRVRQAGDRLFAVEGTPTDCVYLALHRLLPRPPALVVSGINHGGNMGDDVLYSGTVAAAMEGALHRLPALAVSRTDPGASPDFSVGAAFTHALAQRVLEHGLPVGTLLNVNVPPAATFPGPYAWCALGSHHWKPTVEERRDPRGKPYFWLGGPWLGHDEIAGTDCSALARRVISVTPLRVSWTDESALDVLRASPPLPGFTCDPPAGPSSSSR
jgi:5'-nucleotidase